LALFDLFCRNDWGILVRYLNREEFPMHISPRRNFLKLASVVVPTTMFGFEPRMFGLSLPDPITPSTDAPVTDTYEKAILPLQDQFPAYPPTLAREVVLVSHFDLNRVKELVEPRPSLARAAWDWGFGDWEDALGAASHTGNRAIAEYLIAKGARPTLFSSSMFGHLEAVKALITAHPDAQHIRGPHGITLLAHAKVGGEPARPVFDYLQSLGDTPDPRVPLPDVDAAALAGIYTFGADVTEQIEVTVDRGQILWTRKGKVGRPIYHLGAQEFYPAGAPAVRIRFREEGTSMLMTINDPELVLMARRKQESK
jgi:hypothetical protein